MTVVNSEDFLLLLLLLLLAILVPPGAAAAWTAMGSSVFEVARAMPSTTPNAPAVAAIAAYSVETWAAPWSVPCSLLL